MDPTFAFTTELFELNVEPTWVMATVPDDISDEIADLVPDRAGFGSVRVEVTLGELHWKTSLFPSAQRKAYVVPIKKAIRTSAKVDTGDTVDLSVRVVLDDL